MSLLFRRIIHYSGHSNVISITFQNGQNPKKNILAQKELGLECSKYNTRQKDIQIQLYIV